MKCVIDYNSKKITITFDVPWDALSRVCKIMENPSEYRHLNGEVVDFILSDNVLETLQATSFDDEFYDEIKRKIHDIYSAEKKEQLSDEIKKLNETFDEEYRKTEHMTVEHRANTDFISDIKNKLKNKLE